MLHDSTSRQYLDFLRHRASLRLMWYINIARRMPVDKIMTEWPAQGPLPEPWQGRWKDLKHVVRAYGVRKSHPQGGVVNKDTAVEPQDFLKCDGTQGPTWEWLREVCEWSAIATGNTSSRASDAIEGPGADARGGKAIRRRPSADKDRAIRSKLKQARQAILRHYPERPETLKSYTMALRIVGSTDGRLTGGYGFSAIKNWIDGRLESANTRGCPNPWPADIKLSAAL